MRRGWWQRRPSTNVTGYVWSSSDPERLRALIFSCPCFAFAFFVPGYDYPSFVKRYDRGATCQDMFSASALYLIRRVAESRIEASICKPWPSRGAEPVTTLYYTLPRVTSQSLLDRTLRAVALPNLGVRFWLLPYSGRLSIRPVIQ